MKKYSKLKTSTILRSTRGDRFIKANFARARHGIIGSKTMVWNSRDIHIPKFRLDLYRFLRDNIPLLSACIWTWSRLASAPGRFVIAGASSDRESERAEACLKSLGNRLYPYRFQRMAGLDSLLPMLFNTLFTDGAFAGIVLLSSDQSEVEGFYPLETGYMTARMGKDGRHYLATEYNGRWHRLDSDDFYYFAFDTDAQNGLGRSIFAAIPFVAYIEQQLIEDMRRAVHNAGYYRLHVQITPPEKMSGEAENAYVKRANDYFDDTVSMIKDLDPEDNPVTWDNVKVDYIGPRNVQGIGNSWFMNHRTMVEEICAGTNLSPFMLGYSYGTTHNWAKFKYDLVMRQVSTVQRQTSRFLEWLGNIELALKGLDCSCRYVFDNSLSYNAKELVELTGVEVDSLLKLFQAGLISREAAAAKAGELI